MIRNIVLTCMIVLMASLGPVLAQDYYVKKHKSAGEEGAKPTLFNKVKPSQFTHKQSVVKYKDKLNVKNLKNKSLAKLKDLGEWQASGKKPSNAQELLAYAQAHRAVAQNLMYERREALIKHLEKNKQTIDLSIYSDTSQKVSGAMEVQNNDAVEDSKSDTSFSAFSGGQEDEPSGDHKTVKKKRIFIKPKASAMDKAKPTKVFTGYGRGGN